MLMTEISTDCLSDDSLWAHVRITGVNAPVAYRSIVTSNREGPRAKGISVAAGRNAVISYCADTS